MLLAAFGLCPLLRSAEDLFGLAPLAKAGDAKVRSFGVTLRGGESAAGD